MRSLAQLLGVFSFEHIHHAGHGVHGVLAKMRGGPVRGLALRVQPPPKVALVSRDGLQQRGFTGNREIAFGAGQSKFARTGLIAFLIHEADKQDLRVLRPRATFGHVTKRWKNADMLPLVSHAPVRVAARF